VYVALVWQERKVMDAGKLKNRIVKVSTELSKEKMTIEDKKPIVEAKMIFKSNEPFQDSSLMIETKINIKPS
jgi:hypothetical protein